MTDLPAVDGPADEPPVAPSDDDGKLGVAKDRYDRQLDAWLERWKQQVLKDAVRTALAAERQDTQKAVDDNRVDIQTALDAARDDAAVAAETALFKSAHDAYVAVTSSSLDRALTRANFVTAAAGAIVTVYTATLAFAFGQTDPRTGKLLTTFTPAALIPALFLGLSLFLVVVYAAMLRKTIAVGPLLPTGVGGQVAELRLITFMKWCFGGVLARRWALHAGIVSFGLGVATLPVPFVDLSPTQHQLIFWVGIGLVVIATGGPAWLWNRMSGQ